MDHIRHALCILLCAMLLSGAAVAEAPPSLQPDGAEVRKPASTAAPTFMPVPTSTPMPAAADTLAPGPHLPGRVEIAAGFQRQLAITMVPEGAQVPDHTWLSSDERVATVDKSGLVAAVSVGDANVTLKVKGKPVSACKVVVIENAFDRKLPFTQSEPGVYISTKSIRYEDDKLVMEVFVCNATESSVSNLGALLGALLHWVDGQPVTLIATPVSWKPAEPLAPGGTTVVGFSLPQSIVQDRCGQMDLTSRAYEVFLVPERDANGHLKTPDATPFTGISAWQLAH